MPRFFLGLDFGGSKSHALVADDDGRALGFGYGGPGNPQSVGYDQMADLVQTITNQALTTAGLTVSHLSGAGFGIAGYDWPAQLEPNRRVVETLGLNAPFEIVNDTIVGLLAGAAVGWGIALVAGTSCNCHGWDKNRQEGKMTGGGLHMGEAAGATELVDKVIQTIARQWTLRGPATRLTEAFVELADARDCEDLLEGVTMGRYELGAAAAPVVFRVAAEGDTVAKDLILWAGRELGDMANGVIRQLDFEALGFDVVLVGSFFNGSQLLVETIRKTVHTIAPDAHVVRLSAPPVVGGVLLGMQQVGLDTAAVRDTLIRSTAELWKREN